MGVPPHLPDDYYLGFMNKSKLIKDKTKKTYVARTNTIKRLLNADIHTIIYHPEKYNKLLKRGVGSIHSLRSYYVVLMVLMANSDVKYVHDDVYEKWYGYFQEVSEITKSNMINHKASERQVRAHVDWTDIVKARNALDKSSKEYLLMCLTTMIPPRRQMDWFRVRVYMNANDEVDKNINYIHIGAPKPHASLVDYKTVKFFGRWFKFLPKELVSVIKKSLKDEPREYMFLMKNGNPYTRDNSFTRWSNDVLKRVLENKDASMNTLRHSYAIYRRLENPLMTIADKLAIAKDMGHSYMATEAYALDVTPGVVAQGKRNKCFN
jgi:hypothetical protein